MKLWRQLKLFEETEYRQPDNSNTKSKIEFFTLHARPRPSDRILVIGSSDANTVVALAESGPYDVTVMDQSDRTRQN